MMSNPTTTRMLPRALRPTSRLCRRLVLGLESSADDTCASVVEGTRVLSNVVLKQDIHEKHGGIHPQLAQREHQRQMPLAIVNSSAWSPLAGDTLNFCAATSSQRRASPRQPSVGGSIHSRTRNGCMLAGLQLGWKKSGRSTQNSFHR